MWKKKGKGGKSLQEMRAASCIVQRNAKTFEAI
jgi:hypothetical protein